MDIAVILYNFFRIPEFQSFIELSPAASIAGQLMKSTKR